jgi:hypothetical protein
MNRSKALSFLLVLLLAALFASSCSHLPTTGGTGNGGNATVSFTLVADTPPVTPSILSFKVTIVSIALTPTTGTALTLSPSPAIVDLMRLQSDTAFLGVLANVPAGNYTVQISLSNPVITFLNNSTSTITANGVACLSGAACTASLTAAGVPTITSFTFTATSSGLQGIELDFNLNNAVSISGGTLSVNFNPTTPSPAVFTAFTLPRTNANLSATQIELIEDFTGVVSITGTTVTITSPVRGTLTATGSSSSFFDPSPNGLICPTPSTITCVVNGQIASVDAFLNSDGTLSLKEFEPLNATQQDFVEGTVYAVNNPTQFAIAVTDEVLAATGSLITGLNTGDLLTVNLGSQPFLVDTKGLVVPPASLALFQNLTDTSAIHLGQTVAVHPTTFAAANGTTIAAANVDTVTLRWSRFRANVVSASATTFNIDTLPSYFGISGAPQEVVQAFFTGGLGADGVTNLEGVANSTSGLTVAQPVGLRVLYLQNSGFTANPAFFAAKVRQP